METKQCTKCSVEKLITEFYKQSRLKDGSASQCKQCSNISYTNSRRKKPEHYLKVQKNRTIKTKEAVDEYKTKCGCIKCGENDSVCLDMHHIDPTTKESEVSTLYKYSLKRAMKEVEKCVVLCANCHRKLHASRFTLEDLGVGKSG